METPNKIQHWRRETRRKLMAARLEAGAWQRGKWCAAIESRLEALLINSKDRVCGLFWPFQGEFDPRGLADTLMERGAQTALPMVVRPHAPLEFHRWRPGDSIERDAYGIPAPKGRNLVEPDVVLIPLVGFDGECYRLGYGGGFFDRTLAAMRHKPLAIGIGYELGRMETIFPGEHDIPMDMIVTERSIFQRRCRGWTETGLWST